MQSTMNPTTSSFNESMLQPANYSSSDVDPSYHSYYKYAKQENIYTSGSQPGASTLTTKTEAVPVTKKPGLMSKLGAKVTEMAHRAEDSLGLTPHSSNRWNLFGIQDNLLAEFPCKAMNGLTSVRGYLFISSNYLCFASHTDTSHRVAKVIIPLNTIMGIRQSQKVRGANRSSYTFTPITPDMAADCIQIATRDNLLHSFFGFRTQYINAFNILNHAWATACGMHIPASGVNMGMTTPGMTTTPAYSTTGTSGATGYTTTTTVPVGAQMSQAPLGSQLQFGQKTFPGETTTQTSSTVYTTNYPTQK